MNNDSKHVTYPEFRQKYEEQRPASIPQYEPPLQDNPRWMTWATFAMFICAAALSGVHTVPTAYITIEALKVAEYVRQPVAMGTFIFVELGILMSSYTMFKKWSWIAFGILLLCISIAIVANLYSVFQAMKTNDTGAMIVGISLGIGAPLIAMMSGKQYVNLHRSEQIAEMRARQKFKDDLVQHDEDVQVAWDQWQIKLEMLAEKEVQREQLRIEREAERERIHNEQEIERIQALNSLNEANERMNEQPRLPYSANSSGGYTKRMDAKSVIREFFERNADTLNSKLDEVVQRIESESGVKVGRTSVHNVRTEILQRLRQTQEQEPSEVPLAMAS